MTAGKPPGPLSGRALRPLVDAATPQDPRAAGDCAQRAVGSAVAA